MIKILYIDTEAKGFIEEDYYKLSYDQIFSNLYGYCFMFDPFILAHTESIPGFIKYSSTGKFDDADLVIVPHRLTEGHYGKERLQYFIKDIIKFGNKKCKLLLTQPDRMIYKSLGSLKDIILEGELISNHEYFKMQDMNIKERIYPGKLTYQLIHGVIEDEEIKGTIGERIAVLIRDSVAISTIDLFMAYYKSRNYNILESSDDFSCIFTKIIYELLGFRYTAEVENKMHALLDLRRDYHSFAFAYVLIKELLRLKNVNLNDKLAEAESLVLKSAKELVGGDIEKAKERLKSGFEILYKLRLKAAPIEIYLMDSLHGGTLWDDYGYAEYDWPQGVAKLFEIYIKLVEERDYRFNYEVEAHTIENFNKRFPLIYKKFAKLWQEGKIEIVNGTYSQPYSFLCSPESNIRQFEHGIDIIKQIFGVGWQFNPIPVTYIAQEHGLNPQMPQILTNFGYKYACHLIQNTGDVPAVKEDKIFWSGKDDSMIESLPAHSEKSYKKGEALYIHLPKLIAEALKNKYRYAAFVNMQDESMCNFREETIRANFYYPVFGRFSTFKEFFEKTERPKVAKKFRIDDYKFMTILDSYESLRGNENTCCIESLILEHVLTSAEIICGIFSCINRKDYKLWKYWERHWKILNMLQNHDVVIVNRGKVGSYGYSCFYQYLGPMEDITAGELARRDFRFAYDDAIREIEYCMKNLLKSKNRGTRRYSIIFNPLSIERKGIPPCGYMVTEGDKTRSKAAIRDDKLSNEFLEVSIDKKTGALNEIFLIKDKKQLLNGLGNELVYANKSDMICKDIKVNNKKKQMECSGLIRYKGKNLCDYTTKISLNGRVISFITRLNPLGNLNGNPWTNSIRARFATAFRNAKALRCWLNVSEETKLERFNSLYFTRLESGKHTFALYNKGNQFYIRNDNVLENLLKFAYEEMEEFEYAIGIDEENGLISSLCWQVPLFEMEIKGEILESCAKKFSFVSIDKPDILISNCRYLGRNKFHLRLMETKGKGQDIKLTFAYPVDFSVKQDYQYVTQDRLTSSGNTVSLSIKPWEIVQMFVSFIIKNGDFYETSGK